MNIQTNKDIEVGVTPHFKGSFYQGNTLYYAFKYTITITNNSQVPIKVDSRFWQIYDSLNETKIVQGSGIVGEQPIILPLDSHSYSSSCILQSSIGSMEGYYKVVNLVDNKFFKVQIPNFKLIASYAMN
ncbi:Co2+/Mg2+ efflux protein ApaG [Myroides sp. LJL115]